jgi:uncharacterized protein (TIGR03663 family)
MSRSRAGSRRVAGALVAVAAAGLLARVWALGWRVAHQDESRVAHWVLRYMELGGWEYRAIIHGPFIPHVNGVVFDLLGPSDFSMRLVMAVVGALLPLAAWLYRDYLSNVEVVAVAAFLAANPVLLYYSRFMRNDLLLGAFMFAAFGCFVRAAASGKPRYLYLGAVPFALAFTTKENALLYPVCWLGALALAFDGRMLRAHAAEDDSRAATARRLFDDAKRAGWRYKHHLLASFAVFAGIVVAFYAPKPEFYRLATDPGMAPGVLREATLGTWGEFTDLWTASETSAHSYLAYLEHDVDVMVAGAGAVTLFALFGFVHERYTRERPRAVVDLCFYWAAFSLFGYPAVVDISAAWTTINTIAPAAVPAAVGAGVVVEYGRRGLEIGRPARARVAAAVLVVAAAGTGAVAAQSVYANAQGPGNPLVQFAQTSGHMQPTLAEIEDRADANDGIDVVFYGEEFYTPGEATTEATLAIDDYDDPNDRGGGHQGWFERLPLPWYLETYDANVSSTTQAADLVSADAPVLVVPEAMEDDLPVEFEDRGYERYVYPRYQSPLSPGPLVIFVASEGAA